jgi:hypothetical protein
MLLAIGISVNAWADDTAIYGTVNNVDLEPNVLILFDSSGSMGTVDVPGDPYDFAVTYPGSFPTNAVYVRKWKDSIDDYIWNLFADDVYDLNCEWIRDELLDDGNVTGKIRKTNFTCGGKNQRRLRLGNYMNYDESGIGETKSRIDVAKQVITDLINITDDVRFGLLKPR